MSTNLIRTAAVGGLLLAICTGGLAVAQELSEKYVDDKYDFTISVAKPWKPSALKDFTVPGVARAAYSQSDGSSIVLFIQEADKAYSPRFLVDESAKSMEKVLGATIVAKEVRTVADKKAMWMVIEGKGIGTAIDGKGPVKTSQHWVAIPRERDVLVTLLTSPSDKFDERRKSFEEALGTLMVGGKQTSEQSDSGS